MKTRTKILGLFIAFLAMASSISAQIYINNGGFEYWGNNLPGNNDEPKSWYSNKTGSSTAQSGPQTAFRETNDPHSGTSCVRIETKDLIIAKVNGSLTTGVINAPNTDKSRGYVGTKNYTTPSDERRRAFSGRPDSLVGWYKYTQGGGAEQAKVIAVLHKGHYNDPEVPVAANAAIYSDLSANRIGKALFISPAANANTWTRFSVPFDYALAESPEYIMISITSSENQMTNVAGSKLWLDDLQVIYNPYTGPCVGPSDLVVTQHPSSVDLSWVGAPTVPVQGYGYSIVSSDSAQTPLMSLATGSTSIFGITSTTAQYPENFIVGTVYNVYVMSVCNIESSNVSAKLTQTFLFDGQVGMNQTNANEFQVYAFDKQISIDLTDISESQSVLTLLYITGKEVFRANLNGSEKHLISIPASIKQGTYFYKVSGNNIQKTGKIAL
jgi:hypothetical protein